MDVALVITTIFSFISSMIMMAWFKPLKSAKKIVNKIIYFLLALGFSAFALHIYLYSGFF